MADSSPPLPPRDLLERVDVPADQAREREPGGPRRSLDLEIANLRDGRLQVSLQACLILSLS